MAWDITSQKFQGVVLKLKKFILSNCWRSSFSFMSKKHESSWLNRFEVGELFQDLDLFTLFYVVRIQNMRGRLCQNPSRCFSCENLKWWADLVFQPLHFPK